MRRFAAALVMLLAGSVAAATTDAATAAATEPPAGFTALSLSSTDPAAMLADLQDDLAAGDPRILGGRPVGIASRPWQVFVLLQDGAERFQCGGSLIAPKWVLTSASCIQRADGAAVITGVSRISEATAADTTAVLIPFIHDRWDPDTFANDVALLRLERRPARGKPIRLDRLATGPAVGTSARVAGWGTTSEGGQTSDRLRMATVEVLAGRTDACGSYASWTVPVDPATMLCTGMPGGGVAPCQGDTGGPVVTRRDTHWRLAGIVSFANGCGRPNYPGVSTRVSHFARGITSLTYLPKVEVDGTAVDIEWDRPAVDRMVVDYVVQHRLDGQDWITVDDGVSTRRHVVVNGLEADLTYRFRITAVERDERRATPSLVLLVQT